MNLTAHLCIIKMPLYCINYHYVYNDEENANLI